MRKQCKRKVWALVDPVSYAIDGAAITPRKELDKLLARELGALDAFTRGRARMAEWQELVAMVNVTETICGAGIGPEALPSVRGAEAALVDAARRYQDTGRMGLTGEGIKAIRDVIEYHDLQRSSISRSEYERLIRLTSSRIKSGAGTIDLDKTLGPPREKV
jgi:hypothetical protein